MNEKAILAPVEDVIGATELIYENESTNPMFGAIFETDNVISLVNFGCVGQDDKVLVMAKTDVPILGLLSYSALPGQLVSIDISEEAKQNQNILSSQNQWNTVSELLTGYLYTKPEFQRAAIENIQYHDEHFDVCILEAVVYDENTISAYKGRFVLETGEQYENFEKLIKKAANLLKCQGRLLALCKPGWILKCWELLEKLGLELEYENYRIYTEGQRHPNVYLWMRFTKKHHDFSIKDQKRNLLTLMKDNDIDRLYAHRNNLVFPYVELSYSNAEGYVQLDQELQHLQYFFSLETTKNLAQLCQGYTACLTTPSIAQYAHENNKNVVLFEQDNRFRQIRGLKFVRYDLNTGLTKLNQNKYQGKFDRVICDPPFDVKLGDLSRDIVQLLKPVQSSMAYVVFPSNRKASLINAMALKGLMPHEDTDDIVIEYTKPPKLVRVEGKNAITLFKFTFNAQE